MEEFEALMRKHGAAAERLRRSRSLNSHPLLPPGGRGKEEGRAGAARIALPNLMTQDRRGRLFWRPFSVFAAPSNNYFPLSP